MPNKEGAIPVAFSLYTDADHDGFCSCINDFYKGGYPYREFLDRAYLHHLTAAGDLIITLARDTKDRIVGVSAALRRRGRFEGSVLLLLRCIRKEARGRGIGDRQEVFLLEQIDRHFPDTRSLYADVMTHDAISQTTMLHHGFVFCGLRMTLYKNEIMVPHIPYERGTKMTQAIYCKPCGSPEARVLYAPAAHRDALQGIYDSLLVPVTFAAGDAPPLGECEYRIEVNDLHRKVELFIDAHGATDRLQAEIGGWVDAGYTAVAYLNMSRAGCVETERALAPYGFIFSGVKPLSDGGEYLVLSNPRGCLFLPDNIKLPPEAMPLYQTILKGVST